MKGQSKSMKSLKIIENSLNIQAKSLNINENH